MFAAHKMHYLEQLFNAFFRHAHPVGPSFFAEHLVSEEQKRKVYVAICSLSRRRSFGSSRNPRDEALTMSAWRLSQMVKSGEH